MTAYLPHKDTAIVLADIQKQYIYAYNKDRPLSEHLFPRYPLFAFAQKEKKETICSCIIKKPAAEGSEVFFPFILTYSDGTEECLRIIFASLGMEGSSNLSKESAPDSTFKTTFPIRVSTVRQAEVEMTKNRWEVFSDRWYKIRPVTS